MDRNYKRVKLACYITNMSSSVVSNLSPLCFLIFHSLYNISYSLLGLLVLINFCTQLTIDLIFSVFAHKFNMEKAVKLAPVLSAIGLIVYSILPTIFPNHTYVGLVIGTIIFSASGGLVEVLISPVVAAIPAKDPDREMSKLHSAYAWGVVGIVIFGTVFLKIFSQSSWNILVLIFALIPITASCVFQTVKVPTLKSAEKGSGAAHLFRNKGMWLCVIAIFFGGASECIMAQWCSSYIEGALGIPKIWGDIFGVALFSVMLGLGRSLYGKFGRRIYNVLIFGALSAFVCYFLAAVIGIPVIGLIACALTGFCVSMLWPGSLIAASEKFPTGGVIVFALMALGGDLGASVGPQLVGIITDFATINPTLVEFATSIALTPDQLGMKLGMLVGSLFPLMATVLFVVLKRSMKKNKA